MFNFLILSLNAQAQTAAAEGPKGFMAFLPFILIFGIFYFLMIRPQQKRMKEEQNLLAGLNKGDEVYTKAGLLGTITGMTDKIVTLEVSEGIKLKVLRGQVAGLSSKIFEKESKK